jgi:hypothetical protein
MGPRRWLAFAIPGQGGAVHRAGKLRRNIWRELLSYSVNEHEYRAVTLVDAEQLGGTLLDQLAQLFDEEPATGRRRG